MSIECGAGAMCGRLQAAPPRRVVGMEVYAKVIKSAKSSRINRRLACDAFVRSDPVCGAVFKSAAS
jgi:hypothetical protein